MLALTLALAACTPLGAAVATKAEAALAKPSPHADKAAVAREVESLERHTRTFLVRQLDFAHYRTSVAEYLEAYAQVVELHLLALPRLAPEQALGALERLAKLTVRVETHLSASPPDWYDGTWEAYVATAGCDSRAQEVLEVAVDYARARSLSGPTRQRLEVELRKLTSTRPYE